MRLFRVTITGADDDVDPEALSHLSTKYPFVEWGVLFSRSREGQSRYPSAAWRQRLEHAWAGNRAMRLSAHLCGHIARVTMNGSSAWLDQPESTPYMRVQLNGFGRSAYDGLETLVSWHATRQWILQVYDANTLARAYRLLQRNGPVVFTILFDASGGTGTLPEKWPAPPSVRHIAYSGGITPENFERVVGQVQCLRPEGALARLPEPETFGLDLETGVRTFSSSELAFDLKKVESILERAAPLVVEGTMCL